MRQIKLRRLKKHLLQESLILLQVLEVLQVLKNPEVLQAVLAALQVLVGVSWSVRVTNSGASQAAVDACSGGLTYYGTYYGAAYLPIHVNCGGARILSLQVGQTVHISGGGFDGTYRVTGSKNVPKGASSEQLRGLGPDAILQTCYTSGNLMRLVGLQKI